MSCIRPDKLAEFARGRSDARIEAHLADCARCKTALERVRAAQSGMRAMIDLPVPEVGVIRGEATVRWARLTPRPRVRAPFAIGLGFAAAAAGLLLMWNGGARPVEENATIVRAVPPPRARVSKLQAVVTLLGGEIKMTRAGATQKLAATVMLQSGDQLASAKDARVAAQWNADEGFLLHGDSQMAIARLEPGTISLDLTRGRLDVRRGGHDPDERLAVSTPRHVVSARGTWFAVAASREVLTVEVLEGTIEVSGSDTTVLHAPVRAVFGRGAPKVTPIGVHEAAAQRRKNEMNLLPAPLRSTTLLDIASDPAGTLAVDGVELGLTPLVVRRSTGRHYVEIQRPGFAPVQQWVTVGNEPGELRVALPPRASETDRSAPLDPAEIEGMIRKRSTQIRACYERRLKVDPELSGTVSLKLRVGEAGQVKQVSVEESTLPDPLVGECLRREARGWAFANGRNATIVYPFVFRPQ